MSECCDDGCGAERLIENQRGTLLAVLLVNGIMFVVVVVAALFASSSALLADSLDNLGDALTYGLSLLAVNRGLEMKAKVALFKGALILVAALAVAAQIIYHLFVPAMPQFELMGGFSVLGLVANSICLLLLWRHRNQDINMRSVWECARNDIASNISVLLAAIGVWVTSSHWPDIIVASLLVIFLLRSAIRVLNSALAELNTAKQANDKHITKDDCCGE